ncbi:class I SAM-dependent methyltransferase [Mariniflexile maritimum]|uniref:class I SAM-dependent methyltransferase n=1 Tax=Mariniflexile maritimum TaxID=2682493 RepID=UPI0012F6C243|nr:class I SAM-dependent methyltransferase [Mariniflexile maritimum]
MANKTENNIRLKVKDHSVSGEVFELIQNKAFGFLETFPQPSPEKLPEYYKSDDYISHTDSKRNLFEKVYHLVKKFSLAQKLKLINACGSSEKKLLDIGCGTGDFLKIAQDNQWQIFGIEPNAQARTIANYKTGNRVFDTEALSKFQPESFDVITLWHVLEHLPNLEQQIQIFKKALKKDGTLIIAVPNHGSFDAKHYRQFWAAYDVPRHLWHFNKTSISNLFSKVSMIVIKTKPMFFDAFYVSLLSEKYKSGTMHFFRAFYIALVSNLKALVSNEASSLIFILKNH